MNNIKERYVLWGCENGGKYKRYKKELNVIIVGVRTCDYPFKLWGKRVCNGKGWTLR